jgi:hypothetical protein
MRSLRTPLTLALVLLAIGLAGVLFTGCAGMKDKEQRCATYGDVYSLYLATTAVRPVSKDESAGAAAAAIFLRAYCGWVGPKAGPGSSTVDSNGVPILYPPTPRE